jgi:hypothetical protein
MVDFYVAGPVLGDRGDRIAPDIEELYDLIRGRLQERGYSVSLPEVDPYLEGAPPEQFFEAIRGRIESSEIIITVFTGENISASIEAVIASVSGKPQGILVRDRDRVPRLLAGLPGVVSVEQFDSADALLDGFGEPVQG